MPNTSNGSPVVEMRSRKVGPWGLNAYVLICTRTRRSVLIDPGAEPDRLQEMLTETKPTAILVTHRHPDHVGALEVMRRQLKVPVMAHGIAGNDQDAIKVDHLVAHGESAPLGQVMLQMMHTPGHTHDQICIAVEADSWVFVGDTIFEGGPGHTSSSQDFMLTLQTLSRIVLTWPNETICFPGHGPAFRMGDIRSLVREFVKKDHGHFFGDATWEM